MLTSLARITNVFGCVFRIRIKFFNLRATDISVKNLSKSFSIKSAGVSPVNFSTNSKASNGFRAANPVSLGFS